MVCTLLYRNRGLNDRMPFYNITDHFSVRDLRRASGIQARISMRSIGRPLEGNNWSPINRCTGTHPDTQPLIEERASHMALHLGKVSISRLTDPWYPQMGSNLLKRVYGLVQRIDMETTQTRPSAACPSFYRFLQAPLGTLVFSLSECGVMISPSMHSGVSIA